MRILVVHNPDAGHDRLSRSDLAADLQRAGHAVSWCDTRDGTLAASLRGKFDTVVVAGGDGSVGAVGRALAGRTLPIAILPAGTANNLASALGATRENLIATLAGGRVVPFDVGVIEGSPGRRLFLEGVGRGPFADTVALFERLRHTRQTNGRDDELERDREAMRASVRRSHACACRIACDGEEIADDFVMVEITNAGVIGPNLRLSPGAVPFDGLLDIFLVRADEREALMAMIPRKANAPPAPTLPVRRARTVRFQAPPGQHLHIDGDLLVHDAPLDMRISLRPGALRFLVPG